MGCSVCPWHLKRSVVGGVRFLGRWHLSCRKGFINHFRQKIHTMSTFMQILCRVLLSGLAKALALMLLAFAAQANAPEDSTRQGMLEQAKTWMAQLEGKPAAQIQFAPMGYHLVYA
jgi:hypothetical protein